PKGYRTVKKISSPICDAIICNNKSNHFISIQLFLTNTLKLTTLPVLRVGGATGARHIQMSARKNMQACFVLPEHCMAGLVESNSSARAIRKTALRAYCGCRHCFTHKKALSTYRCPLAKTCKHVLCFPNTIWLNCCVKVLRFSKNLDKYGAYVYSMW
uniref:hypothetical protein n=2 Tax=[Ruminococcus] torques TaxID=33039 RepID=UPI003AB99EFA